MIRIRWATWPAVFFIYAPHVTFEKPRPLEYIELCKFRVWDCSYDPEHRQLTRRPRPELLPSHCRMFVEQGYWRAVNYRPQPPVTEPTEPA